MVGRLEIFVVSALCAVAVLPIPEAVAGDLDCQQSSHVVTINLDAEFRNVRLFVKKDAIMVQSGVTTFTCGGATVNNTDKIRIIDTVAGADADVTVSFQGGPFAPGFTNEDGSSDEIEFIIKLGTGDNSFDASATTFNGNVNFRAGTAVVETNDGTVKRLEVNLNAGETTHVDHDVVVNGSLSNIALLGSQGADRLGAHGGAGTGGAYEGPASLAGLTGSDVITGGLNDDFINTSNLKCLECFPDADKAFGGPGADEILGGKASDELRGEKGGDTIEGHEGNDDLFGGAGGDSLSGGDGDDDLDGGDGEDGCQGGSGTDSLDNCESGQP